MTEWQSPSWANQEGRGQKGLRASEEWKNWGLESQGGEVMTEGQGQSEGREYCRLRSEGGHASRRFLQCLLGYRIQHWVGHSLAMATNSHWLPRAQKEKEQVTAQARAPGEAMSTEPSAFHYTRPAKSSVQMSVYGRQWPDRCPQFAPPLSSSLSDLGICYTGEKVQMTPDLHTHRRVSLTLVKEHHVSPFFGKTNALWA